MNELEGEIRLLLRACDTLHPALIRKIETSRLFPPTLSYRGRVKHESSVLEKIERKRRLRPNYGVGDVTDLIGIRIITLVRMGIADVTDSILSLLTKSPAGDLGDFGSAKLLEFKQYISPPLRDIDPETGDWIDPLHERLKAQLAAHYPSGAPVEFGKPEIRAQYSSVHLVIAFPTALYGHERLVPVEFQVRSVFEEAWGELDHLLFYEADRSGLVAGERHRLAASRHLGILKGMLDTAATYAELIYEMDLTSAETPKPDIRPNLDGIDYAGQVAAPITHRREVIDEFLGLVRAKASIDENRAKGTPTVLREYLGLAHKFEQLFENKFKHIDPGSFPPDQLERVRSLAFLVLMEQAISLFLDGDAASVLKAVELYERITSPEQLFPGLEGRKYPTAWFRLGEAKNWLMELSPDAEKREQLATEAAAAFAKARTTLSSVPSDQPLIIAPHQCAYLDENIERLRGFALWRLSDKRRKVPGARPQPIDLENVRKAWKIVEKRAKALTVPFSMSDLNLFNTATYFAADGLDLCKLLGQPIPGFPSSQSIQRMLDTLDKEMKRLGAQEERFSHTILFCALLLDDEVRALRAAEEVMDAHVKADTMHFTPYQKDMHEFVAREAWEVIRRGGARDKSPN